jgi:hypothetical protein
MVNSLFVTDAEFTVFLNSGYAELYELLVKTFEDYFLTSTTFATVAGQDTYSLPAGMFKLRGVDLVLSPAVGQFIPLDRFEWDERWKFSNGWSAGYTAAGQLLNYTLVNKQLMLAPAPDSSYSIRVWFVPVFTPLALPADLTVDLENDWGDYIVLEAAIRALQKEESDVSALFAQKNSIISRINSSAMDRDVNKPMRMTKTRTERWDSEDW